MTVRQGLQIEVLGIPAENGKCRVETQLKITLRLANAQGESVKDWKQLRLPHSLIAKEKHRMEKFNGRNKHIQDSEILTLDARLVCDHDMTKVLECCDNCIGRERKRAHRRKESQKLPGPLGAIPIFGAISPKNGTPSLDNEPVPPTPTDPVEYQAWERHRIMVFSSTEYVDISSGQCLLPTRITCYCRHHNEKVGFRIQFTARDSTGAVVASVLTNAVMMMDDHKSGKKSASTQLKRGEGSTKPSIGKNRVAAASDSVRSIDNQAGSDQLQEYDEDQDDMDQDEIMQEDMDEIDLEAGHHIPQDDFSDVKLEHSEVLSGDILSPLVSAADRIGSKRRVDENMMDDIQMQGVADPSRGPSRRKTSHDITAQGAGASMPFGSTAPYASSTSMEAMTSPSPFMPGSPFAGDEQNNAFSPSFAQAMSSGGSFLDPKNMDIFLRNSLLTTSDVQRSGSTRRASKDAADNETSMMEFTTFDESMSSPPNAFQAVSLPLDTSTVPVSQALTTSIASFSTTAPSFSASGALASSGLGSSNPFNSTGMLTSAYSTTFSSPLNGSASTASVTPAPGMSASFLDASQMQEFQNFKRQSILQQKQQQLLMQLQQGVQQQNKQGQMGSISVPWTATTDSRDPFMNMKTARSQTTSPFSSAFITAPSSSSKAQSSATAATETIATIVPTTDGEDAKSSGMAPAAETALAPKKRGRPRKVATKSEAGSPVLLPKTPMAIPSSPSPPPATTPVQSVSADADAAAAAAAQFMLLQQRQQQQMQHHQQQLQQQQKQAILARQKPRVQKIIPSRGPVEGGVEITLLGSGFFPGVVLTFDGVPALNVQYYGPETVICRLPPRAFPGTVVVKAQNPMSASTPAAPTPGSGQDDGSGGSSSSSELVRTISQLFGAPTAGAGQLNHLLDDDVGVLFEYEESKGDRDLIALALQVLGMKMNGRVEPPHQVAMRIMGTAAASNAILGQQDAGASSSQTQQQQQQLLQLPQLPQQQQVQNTLLGLGGPSTNTLQANGLQQQLMLQQRQIQQSQLSSQQLQLQQAQQLQQQQRQRQQSANTLMQQQSGSMANGSLLGSGMLGFSSFMNSTGGSSGGGL